MKDIYTYNISVDCSSGGTYSSVSWEESFSRYDVKGFFDPEKNTFFDMIGELPPLFDDGEEASITEEERTRIEKSAREQVDDFEFTVILEDCLNIWLEDLARDYREEAAKLNPETASAYESRYNEAMNAACKDESVRVIFALVNEMKESSKNINNKPAN